jgi:hypothetical protein
MEVALTSSDIFYLGYLVEKHRVTGSILWEQLLNKNKSKILNTLKAYSNQFDDSEFEKIIQVQMRSQFILLIDDIFELIFCLYPFDGKSKEHLIVKNLIQPQFAEIKKFYNKLQNNELKSDFFSNSNGPSKGFNIFYLNELPNLILEESLKNIYELLKICDRIMGDRTEINSIKHGGRIFPLIESKTIENGSQVYSNRESVTFFSKLKDTEESKKSVLVQVKGFNTKEIFSGICLLSDLLSNIIAIRKFNALKKIGKEPSFPICKVFQADRVEWFRREFDSKDMTISEKGNEIDLSFYKM